MSDVLSPAHGLSADPGDELSWFSAYVFYDGFTYGTACDHVVVDVVEPFQRRALQEGWAEKIFFIRYSEDGSHVRARFYGDPDVLVDTVGPALVEHVRDALDADAVSHPRSERESGDLLAEHPVRFVPYEREVNRYGGPEAVRLAEDFFEASSLAAFDLIRQSRDKGHSARLGKGLLTMVIKVHAFCDGDREAGARLMRQYHTGYLQAVARGEDDRKASFEEAFDAGFERQADTLRTYVDAVWEALDAGASLSDTLDPYHEDVTEVRRRFETLFDEGVLQRGEHSLDTWERAVRSIVPSYVHMTNNRLGIPIPEESYLAHCIVHALGAEEVLEGTPNDAASRDAAPQDTAPEDAS
jgi:thiopeptide-type bacteriocin biosynthesis protein